MTGLWPWLTLAGLGAFHGLNPAMGWLFAVALGQHRKSRRVVLVSLVPIAVGHAAAILAAVAAILALGIVVDGRSVRLAAGTALLGWAAYHTLYGHRHRVRVGMQTGMAGLALWSFLMATAHGAGLMLLPVLIPLHEAQGRAHADHAMAADGSLWIALAGVGVHTAALLVVTGGIALMVY